MIKIENHRCKIVHLTAQWQMQLGHTIRRARQAIKKIKKNGNSNIEKLFSKNRYKILNLYKFSTYSFLSLFNVFTSPSFVPRTHPIIASAHLPILTRQFYFLHISTIYPTYKIPVSCIFPRLPLANDLTSKIYIFL